VGLSCSCNACIMPANVATRTSSARGTRDHGEDTERRQFGHKLGDLPHGPIEGVQRFQEGAFGLDANIRRSYVYWPKVLTCLGHARTFIIRSQFLPKQ
jgi:hypothetical protein